jgi:hypothetical protein
MRGASIQLTAGVSAVRHLLQLLPKEVSGKARLGLMQYATQLVEKPSSTAVSHLVEAMGRILRLQTVGCKAIPVSLQSRTRGITTHRLRVPVELLRRLDVIGFTACDPRPFHIAVA